MKRILFCFIFILTATNILYSQNFSNQEDTTGLAKSDYYKHHLNVYIYKNFIDSTEYFDHVQKFLRSMNAKIDGAQYDIHNDSSFYCKIRLSDNSDAKYYVKIFNESGLFYLVELDGVIRPIQTSLPNHN